MRRMIDKELEPNALQISEMWSKTTLQEVKILSEAAQSFIQTINWYKESDGVQIHQYKLMSTPHLDYYVRRNKLREINFPKNILQHKDLEGYRKNLKIAGKPFVEVQKCHYDIFQLPGYLAGVLAKGLVYNHIDQKVAWQVSKDFVTHDFEHRFLDVVQFDLTLRNAKWFCDSAWDYSIFLFDRRNYTILIIDITDCD